MNNRIFLRLSLLLLGLAAADVLLGSVSISAKAVLGAILHKDVPSHIQMIVNGFRIPKMCTALLCGCSLGVCGLQMQTLFRNPLADPYILGISSGAGLGVALFIMGSSAFGWDQLLPSWMADLGTVSAAWAGALAVTLLVVAAAGRLKSNLSLLVLGIMIGSAGSALVGLLQSLSNAADLKVYVLWTMGSFANVTHERLLLMTALCLCGLALSIYNIKELNILLMGEAYAQSLGINIRVLRNRIFLATILLAGSVTAFCGPIGFVGIAVPHIARRLTHTANHRTLIPASAMLGAAIMLLADLLSQLPGTHQVVPVNTMAALLGIPVILAIIIKSKNAV